MDNGHNYVTIEELREREAYVPISLFGIHWN